MALITCAGCGGNVEVRDLQAPKATDAGVDQVVADAVSEGDADADVDVADEQPGCTVGNPTQVEGVIFECTPNCCDEGSTACLEITVDESGIIVGVAASAATDQDLTVDLACAQERLLGACSGFAGEVVTRCAAGM